MKDGKQTESIPIPLRRIPSSSSTITASTYSHTTSNDERAGTSIFSRSPSNSTCNSTINSSSTKDESTTSRLQAPKERKRRSSFRETASQLISSSSSFRGRSPPSSKAKTPSPTTSTGSGKTATRRSRSDDRPAHQNVHTECGRHSDDWLFGGFSITGSIKKMMDKKDKK